MDINIKKLLELAVANKASDIHLIYPYTPYIRVDGNLIAVTQLVMEGEVEEKIRSVVPERMMGLWNELRDLDFSISIADGSRFRVNVYREMGRWAAAFRLIPSTIPPLEDLGVPNSIWPILDYKQGFLLVTGPTGSGKSTTVASMLQEINQKRACHIVTIEDPVEYVLPEVKAIITQRELGADTVSFSQALVSCLRQDPNIVFVGEMRDLETIQLALTVAETGHLVVSTLHTNSAAQTIDRIIDSFPDEAKNQVRQQLSNVMTAVVSQRLLPKTDGGRVAAFEVLMVNSAVRNVIREEKIFMIDNIIQTSADAGMIAMDRSLAVLVRKGLVAEEEAVKYSSKPSEFEANLRGVKL